LSESLLSSVAWRGGELPLTEHATLWRTEAGYALRGTVVGVFAGAPLTARYAVECSEAWITRTARVELVMPPELREVHVVRGADGGWTVDGSARPELDGLMDVDIQVTPSTNTLPIERLALSVGEEAEVTAVWIRVPELVVSPLRQSYKRMTRDRYAYRSGDFGADITVAADRLVETYGSFWSRLVE
jgi:hypothetical protein